jgi:hypothetical protein
MRRNEHLRDRLVEQLEAFRVSIDKMLSGPGSYFDPAILPDPSRDDDFPTFYASLAADIARDLGAWLQQPLLAGQYGITRGERLPVGGCLLRQDIESMQKDVEASLVTLRALRVSTGTT